MKHYNKPAGCLFCLLLLLALPSLVVLAQQASGARQQLAPQQKPIPANRPDSVSYAFGVSLAQDLKQRGLEQLSPESVAHAIRDVYASHAQLTDDQLRELITVSLTEAMENKCNKPDLRKTERKRILDQRINRRHQRLDRIIQEVGKTDGKKDGVNRLSGWLR